MNEKLLTFKDYKVIVEHCLQSKGSYGIKDSVNDLIKNYGRFNSNIELGLMEYIENAYPRIKFKKNLAPTDFLNFSEEIPSNKNAALDYLYSYLIHLSELKYNDKKGSKINKTHYENIANTKSKNRSFGVRQKHEKNLVKIFETLNDDRMLLYSDEAFPERLAHLFTVKNLSDLSDEEKIFKFLCKTTEIVAIIDMIKIHFDTAFNDYLIDDCLLLTKNNEQLKSGNIQKTRSTTNPIGNRNIRFIRETFEKFALKK